MATQPNLPPICIYSPSPSTAPHTLDHRLQYLTNLSSTMVYPKERTTQSPDNNNLLDNATKLVSVSLNSLTSLVNYFNFFRLLPNVYWALLLNVSIYSIIIHTYSLLRLLPNVYWALLLNVSIYSIIIIIIHTYSFLGFLPNVYWASFIIFELFAQRIHHHHHHSSIFTRLLAKCF